MGGQACVFYGAAEFSRNTDIALLASTANIGRLQAALKELMAEPVAVPPLSLRYLKKGFAAHFRCHHPAAEGIRLDVMSVMRGVDDFPALWKRRTTVRLDNGEIYDLMSLKDLVQANKTQRDKDWPMLRRLVESHYAAYERAPSSAHIDFWLRESRTAPMLLSLADRFPARCRRLAKIRPLLRLAIKGDLAGTEKGLAAEEHRERTADRRYWKPLLRELERMRHARIADKAG